MLIPNTASIAPHPIMRRINSGSTISAVKRIPKNIPTEAKYMMKSEITNKKKIKGSDKIIPNPLNLNLLNCHLYANRKRAVAASNEAMNQIKKKVLSKGN